MDPIFFYLHYILIKHSSIKPQFIDSESFLRNSLIRTINRNAKSPANIGKYPDSVESLSVSFQETLEIASVIVSIMIFHSIPRVICHQYLLQHGYSEQKERRRNNRTTKEILLLSTVSYLIKSLSRKLHRTSTRLETYEILHNRGLISENTVLPTSSNNINHSTILEYKYRTTWNLRDTRVFIVTQSAALSRAY